MHRFLTAFLVLSTLAMTQNVVAGTPTLRPGSEEGAVVAMARLGERGAGELRTPSLIGGQIPSAGTMLLLVTGLAGLSAASDRSRRRRPIAGRRAVESRTPAEHGILA